MVATQSRARTGCPSWKRQSVAQRQLPGLAVVLSAVALHHLRLHLELRIVGVQRVEHRQRDVACDVRGGPDRIERSQGRLCGAKFTISGTGGPDDLGAASAAETAATDLGRPDASCAMCIQPDC